MTQNFTKRLDELKFRLNLSDEELAEYVGISRRMLYLMRVGRSAISKKSLYKLAEAEKKAGIATPQSQLAAPADSLPPAERAAAALKKHHQEKGDSVLLQPFREVMEDPANAELKKELQPWLAQINGLEQVMIARFEKLQKQMVDLNQTLDKYMKQQEKEKEKKT